MLNWRVFLLYGSKIAFWSCHSWIVLIIFVSPWTCKFKGDFDGLWDLGLIELLLVAKVPLVSIFWIEFLDWPSILKKLIGLLVYYTVYFKDILLYFNLGVICWNDPLNSWPLSSSCLKKSVPVLLSTVFFTKGSVCPNSPWVALLDSTLLLLLSLFSSMFSDISSIWRILGWFFIGCKWLRSWLKPRR